MNKQQLVRLLILTETVTKPLIKVLSKTLIKLIKVRFVRVNIHSLHDITPCSVSSARQISAKTNVSP